jgi:AcrR family transcriptional regulator
MEIEAHDGEKRRHVAGVQRARIVAAMSQACGELGAANVTVVDVVERAGVSRRTFYELFEDCESCLLRALDDASARAGERVIAAYDPSAPWRERIRASLTALLRYLEEEPTMGRLLIVKSHAAGWGASERSERVLAHVIAAVDAGRGTLKGTPHRAQAGEAKGNVPPPPLSAEGVVGAVLFVIHRRLVACPPPAMGGPRMGEAKGAPLVELVNPLMSMIVLPYLGAAAARAELGRAVVAPQPVGKPRRDALTQLDIRLTYRTMRVLAAIGALGGRGSYPSNRDVGRAAGAADPGQISKLLTRLQRIGLIENREGNAVKGSPNAWTLTRKGAEVERAIAAHSTGSLAE